MLLGLDIGTSSTKALLVDAASALAPRYARFPELRARLEPWFKGV